MSVAIDLIDAALSQDLTKNELKAFLALFKQTICYGKLSDPLTTKRIVRITGIRKDRLEIALGTVLDKGLFEAKEHKAWEKEYFIPSSILEKNDHSFFAPHIPKERSTFRKEEGISENRRHTVLTNTPLTKTLQTAPAETLPNNLATEQPIVCHVSSSEDEVIQDQPIAKPEAVSDEAYKNLLPSLKTLPNQQANEVLQLLSAAILNKTITSTEERLGGGLIKRARAGNLNTSKLYATHSSPKQPSPEELKQREEAQRKREQVADRAHLERMAALANVPIEQLIVGGTL